MRIFFFCSIVCALFFSSAVGEEVKDSTAIDTTIVELDETIRVVGRRVTGERSPFPFEKDRLNRVLAENGFNLITKGNFLAQDVQADGFKRDDISIVIDGERYHSACPNRMDSPLARSNSLEMDAIELDKTSSACCSGIGGSIAYRRARIGDSDKLRAGMSQSVGDHESSDVGFAATTRHHRLAGRFATGSGYTDGDGKTFVDRYGYRTDFNYRLAEASLTGEREGIKYRAEFTYTDDVMFPYLRMDERLNRVFSGSMAYGGHKIYTYYTKHLMDNGLRTSMMSMITDAKNLTVGMTGSIYEVYYRRWEADNKIVTPMISIDNDLMPSVNLFAASTFYDHAYHRLTYWGRLGISRFTIGEKERASFYEALYGDQSTSRTFVNFAAGGAFRKPLSSAITAVAALDLIGEAPSAQSLYIAVRRPMGNPWWSGNPGLKNPIRASVRGKLQSRPVTLEGSASYVWDYVDLTSVVLGGQPYMTYENFDAVILAVNLSVEWEYLNANAGYNWAERRDEGTPLAEIAPFHASYTIRSPQVGSGEFYFRHSYNDAQTRVDLNLEESPTGSWNRFDLGLNYHFSSMRLNLEVENLFDELYTQHLSYLRDPFASGARVYEPGRSLRMNLVLDIPER